MSDKNSTSAVYADPLETVSSLSFLSELLSVAGYYLLLRVVTTFGLAYFMDESWFVQWMWRFVPIISFNTGADTYATINSWSTALTAVGLSFVAWYGVHANRRSKKPQLHQTLRRLAWLLASIMLLPQMITAWYVNDWLEIEIHPSYMLPVVLCAVISIMLYRIYRQRFQVEAVELELLEDV